MPLAWEISNYKSQTTQYRPNTRFRVVSIGRIIKAGYTVQFVEDSCSIKMEEKRPVIGRIPAGANGLFKRVCG